MSLWTFALHLLRKPSVPVHYDGNVFRNLTGFDDIITERSYEGGFPLFLKPRHNTSLVLFSHKTIQNRRSISPAGHDFTEICRLWVCALRPLWLCMMSWQKESRMLFAAMSRFNRWWRKERTFSSIEMTVGLFWQEEHFVHTSLNPEWWTPRTRMLKEVRFVRSHFVSSACNLIVLFSCPKSYRTLFPDREVPLEGPLCTCWIGKFNLRGFIPFKFRTNTFRFSRRHWKRSWSNIR